jgi:hypothetical protein
MRVDLANMARMAATACLEVGTIPELERYLKMYAYDLTNSAPGRIHGYIRP